MGNDLAVTPVDLPQIIIEFLNGLPATIKQDVTIKAILYSGFPLPDFNRALTESPAVSRAAAVIRVAASIDYVLAKVVSVENDNAHVLPSDEEAEELDPELRQYFREETLRHPMRLRHAVAALRTWQALRANALSLRKVLDFEYRCLVAQDRQS